VRNLSVIWGRINDADLRQINTTGKSGWGRDHARAKKSRPRSGSMRPFRPTQIFPTPNPTPKARTCRAGWY